MIKIRTLLLPVIFLLSSTARPAIFDTDHRPNGLIVIGALVASGGLYLMCKESKKSAPGRMAEAVTGVVLISLGLTGMLASKEAIKQFDVLVKHVRGDSSFFD